MTTRQALVPGGGYMNETRTKQALVPGQQYVNETVATSTIGFIGFGSGGISNTTGSGTVGFASCG